MAPLRENVPVEDAQPFECPACGHERAVTIGPTHGGHYRRCLNCGMEIRIISDAESSNESFGTSQEALYGNDEVLNPPSLHGVQHQLAAARLRIMSRYLPSGRLLEVGPGAGALLALAQSKGYHVSAIEHSPALADRLSKKLGIHVACGMVEEMDSSDQAYDGVVSMHVIEHVPDPLKHVVAARAAVSDGGYLFLATPNLGAWTRRLAGNRWPGYSGPHLCLFTASSLSHLLKNAGWEVVGIHTNEHAFNWMWTMLYLFRKPRQARSLKVAGATARQAPVALTAAVISVLEVLAWPMRRLQSLVGGGDEVIMVARAVEQVAGAKVPKTRES